MTRGQMLKDLNDKKEKMSQLVEAAHATRCVSNEKGSSTKKDMSRQQSHTFTQKLSNPSQFMNVPTVSTFDMVSHSAERQQDENQNALNMQRAKEAHKKGEKQINTLKYTSFRV